MWNFTKGLLIIALAIFSLSTKAQVGINNDTPNPAAILDIKSDTLGVLFPRIADSSFLDNEKGLFFYATDDDKFYYYNGSNWQCVNPFLSTGTDNARLNGSLEVQGNVSVEPESTISGYGTIPLGGIIMWSGDHTNVPDGWTLCNGAIVNSIQTPDLRGRFVVGYSDGNKNSDDPRYTSYGSKNNAASLTYQYVGDVGGDTVVELTENNIPQHKHDHGNISINGNGGPHTHKLAQERQAVGSGDGGSDRVKRLQSTLANGNNDETGTTVTDGTEADRGSHTHPSSSFTGNTGNWGGEYHPEEYYYDYSGSKCQYNTTKAGCDDLSPYMTPYDFLKADPCDGSFEPIDPGDPAPIALATPIDPGGPGEMPEFNPGCFLNKPMCKNNDYNPNYGQKIVTQAAYYSQDPVENRPPYYVIAYIIRVK